MSLKYIFILLTLVGGYSLSAKQPFELEISDKACLTKGCFVSQQVTLKVRVIPHGNRTINSIILSSDALSEPIRVIDKPITISEPREIPITFSLKEDLDEREYRLSVVLHPETTLQDAWDWIRGILNQDKIEISERLPVKYPKVKLQILKGESSDSKLFYTITVHNDEDSPLNCSVRIATSPAIKVEHKYIDIIEKTTQNTIYQSNFEQIEPPSNSKCCKKIEFIRSPYEKKSDIIFSPVCRINGHDILIKSETKKESW